MVSCKLLSYVKTQLEILNCLILENMPRIVLQLVLVLLLMIRCGVRTAGDTRATSRGRHEKPSHPCSHPRHKHMLHIDFERGLNIRARSI